MNKLIFFWILLVTFGCKSEINTAAFTDNIDLSVEVAKDVSMIYSDSAIVKIKVTGTTMLTYIDRNLRRKEFPDGLKVEFFNGKKVGSKLTAKFAVQYDSKKETILQDSVVWISGRGEKLETDELVWNEKTKKVSTNRFVKITTTTDVVYGYGFEAEQDFTKWKILAPQGDLNVQNFNTKQPTKK